jgi:dual specificity tyrosine-phosphorylation-regulated kinase 2/3/4
MHRLQSPTLPVMLARMEAMCGPMPVALLSTAKHGHLYYTRSRQLYERDMSTGTLSVLQPLQSSLAGYLGHSGSPGFVSFLEGLLQLDPAERPTAEEALQHPWVNDDPL